MKNILGKYGPFTQMAALSLAAGSLSAAPVIHEPFDYSDSDLSANAQAGVGLSGDWSESGVLVEDPGLTFGTLETGGRMATFSDDSASAETGSTLDGLLDDGDTLWFSVLIRPGNIDVNADIGFALGTNSLQDRNNVPMGGGGSGLGFRVKNGLVATAWSGDGEGRTSPSSAAGVDLEIGEVALVVGELIFGATDTVNLYLPDTDLNLGSVVSTQTATVDQTVFNTITFTNKNTTPRDQIDEIRFGLTSGDVLPVASAPADTFGLTITPAVPPATGFDLQWDSQAGKVYNLRSSTDLVGPIADWTLVEGDIAATPPVNVRNVALAAGVPRNFWAVEEFDAPAPPSGDIVAEE